MSNFKIKETYLLFLIVIGLISLAGYSTYALFTASTEIEDVVEFSTSLSTNNSVLEYERITIPAGETKIVEYEVINSYDSTIYYGAWYQKLTPVIDDYINIGVYIDEGSETGVGTIAAGVTKKVIIGIQNYSAVDLIISLGVTGSLENNLSLSDDRVLIANVWGPNEMLVTGLF